MQNTQENKVCVSIVLPCLNEEKSIVSCIEEIKTTCDNAGLNYEVVVADNGSTDKSAELAEKAGARVAHIKERGYGSAVNGGILAAKGEIVVFADSDCSYPFAKIPQLIKPVQDGEADMVLGNRLAGPIEEGAMPFLNRYFGTPALSFMIRLLYPIGVYDCNGGMRALRKSEYARLKLCQPGMEYASEMLIRAGQERLRYREIPIGLRRAHASHVPHLRRWRDGWRHLKTIVTGRFKKY